MMVHRAVVTFSSSCLIDVCDDQHQKKQFDVDSELALARARFLHAYVIVRACGHALHAHTYVSPCHRQVFTPRKLKL